MRPGYCYRSTLSSPTPAERPKADGILKGKALERGSGQRPAQPSPSLRTRTPLKSARRAGKIGIKLSRPELTLSPYPLPARQHFQFCPDARLVRAVFCCEAIKKPLCIMQSVRDKEQPVTQNRHHAAQIIPACLSEPTLQLSHTKRKATFLRISLYWIPRATYPPGPFPAKRFQGFGMLS